MQAMMLCLQKFHQVGAGVSHFRCEIPHAVLSRVLDGLQQAMDVKCTSSCNYKLPHPYWCTGIFQEEAEPIHGNITPLASCHMYAALADSILCTHPAHRHVTRRAPSWLINDCEPAQVQEQHLQGASGMTSSLFSQPLIFENRSKSPTWAAFSAPMVLSAHVWWGAPRKAVDVFSPTQ